MKRKQEYALRIEVYGFPAYVVDELLRRGMHGLTREGVVERIVNMWILDNMGTLGLQGMTGKDATEKKYIPIKIKK